MGHNPVSKLLRRAAVGALVVASFALVFLVLSIPAALA
jgi:hypothetical protein